MKNEFVNLEEFGMSEEELFSPVSNDEAEAERITAPRYSYWRSVFRVFFKNKWNIMFLSALAVVLLLSYVYPLLTDFDRFGQLLESETKNLAPKAALEKFGFDLHWLFGTGASGQSIFDEVWNGAQFSISLALVCALINMTVGIVVGALWGFSKKVDMVMQEVYNVIANVPYILVVSVMVLIWSGSFWTLVFAMTVTGWLGIAYFIRTQVIIIRDREYNLASRCLGTPTVRIAIKNILPFMTSIIVTLAAAEIPSYISSEVFLTYLNIGTSAETPSLGRMIEEVQNAMRTPGWEYQFWFPVAVVAVVSVVLYVVGQNLGDASDPRTHM